MSLSQRFSAETIKRLQVAFNSSSDTIAETLSGEWLHVSVQCGETRDQDTLKLGGMGGRFETVTQEELFA